MSISQFSSKVITFIFLFTVSGLLSQTPAFPGAEGFGRFTTGGRGGAVIHVTSLADTDTQGTFRWAINQAYTRTIVFDISGTIRLTSALAIRNGNVTIAGQTAPGDGICIADYPFTINASNVIIRFMRFRLGNLFVANHEGDGLGGMDQQNIMVDHCSVSWSIDECLSVYGMKNATIQWCIASQSLRNSGHSKGAHGYGGNWGGSGASYHHNLVCHHDSRTPRLGPRASTQTDERMDMRNNVIYNWGGNGCYGGEGMNVNIVNNYYKPGPGTKQRSTTIQQRIAAIGIRTTSYVASSPSFAPMLHVWGDFYVNGNTIVGYPAVTADNWTTGIYAQISNSSVDNLFTQATKDTMRLAAPINFAAVTTHSAEQAYERVLQYAGASLSRDWIDTLMIYDTRNGKASFTGSGSGNILGVIDSQEDNKPANAPIGWSAWPDLKTTTYPTDTDRDGMPDAWETTQGLNPNNGTDAKTLNTEGFTMLEVYMNSLVAPIMSGGNAGGVLTEKTSNTTPPPTTTTNSFTLSQTTYSSSSTTTNWLFQNNISVSNESAKAYSTGADNGIKYSAGVKYTINLPTGIAIDSINFSGYDNYADGDSYLSELNGVTYPETSYLFPRKDANGNGINSSYTVALLTPASSALTFTFSGKQVVLKTTLYYKTPTGVRTITLSPLDPNGLTIIYSLDGKIVRNNVIRRHALENLMPGTYIVDNRKVSIRY